ncbi:virulence-associated protein E [Pseudomonas aeruginosa]|uniref:Virulence-associated protein E n=1 Tax=Pseudomonas fluorescens TaxID=294 RepID=A0A3S4N0K3_PSEFL|nr:virulence-associated protein E [Pseudomonas aeruginosa]VEE48881.1 virulence-associated protein E [Pseudomonas fluorescens]ALY51066.1 virulence-associated protein E [Pseudomonas aeruginosa]ELF7129255.1 virulence-associated protein E [Pseudomonas aeruginosa]EMB4094699.1 virulence-associated protein E [Pseudomonas aeruginosa]KSI39844.1 virulence-associated protein E [Pseudomonas aeruginosa]
MTPIDKLLPRLDKVKADGKSRWKACCPAHDDKSPSLRVTETEGGTVLLKCWVGCTAAEIVAAVGLQMADLFPGEKRQRSGPSREAIQHERAVYLIGKNLLEQGKEMAAEDLARFHLAKQRLGVS